MMLQIASFLLKLSRVTELTALTVQHDALVSGGLQYSSELAYLTQARLHIRQWRPWTSSHLRFWASTADLLLFRGV